MNVWICELSDQPFSGGVDVWIKVKNKSCWAVVLFWEVYGFQTATGLLEGPEMDYRWQFYKKKKGLLYMYLNETEYIPCQMCAFKNMQSKREVHSECGK